MGWSWNKEALAYLPNDDWTWAELRNGLGYNTKEQTMRNTIKILDPKSKVTIDDFMPGEMFQYKDFRSSEAVYMKLSGSQISMSNSAVLLSTGATFAISYEAVLLPVSSVQIGPKVTSKAA